MIFHNSNKFDKIIGIISLGTNRYWKIFIILICAVTSHSAVAGDFFLRSIGYVPEHDGRGRSLLWYDTDEFSGLYKNEENLVFILSQGNAYFMNDADEHSIEKELIEKPRYYIPDGNKIDNILVFIGPDDAAKKYISNISALSSGLFLNWEQIEDVCKYPFGMTLAVYDKNSSIRSRFMFIAKSRFAKHLLGNECIPDDTSKTFLISSIYGEIFEIDKNKIVVESARDNVIFLLELSEDAPKTNHFGENHIVLKFSEKEYSDFKSRRNHIMNMVEANCLRNNYSNDDCAREMEKEMELFINGMK